ncbi:serine/threonine-protein phosphatase 7 long form homolog [Gastrolobium bilobum]|uniref:serine/threonine-protein phosphatase 7 long form homolog n=1 Tax=Gastrolobium bilobum TaxID=150636 RepID=UPI002AB1CECF|nr:serine/threonine-protein phosphatase 7 long form homolog [Gastrolobium bilobum]
MVELSSSSGGGSDAEPTDPNMYIIPGPYRWDVLRKRTQRAHISQRVWNTEHVRRLKTRRGKPQGGPPTRAIPEVVTHYLTQAGFIHVARMRHLQDVAGILGLPTDGKVVTGSTNEDWPAVCAAAFGAAPQANEFHHSGDLRISFLDRLYTWWTDHAGDHDREIFFTKAHIACMLGCWLLADKSGGSNIGCRLVSLPGGGFDEIGRFSWGSAVLTHLFRNLSEVTDAGRSDMGGCHILLQIWAWVRFPPIAPSILPHAELGLQYGCRFNTVAKFKPHEVVWQPYIDYQWLDVTPEQQYLWLAVGPLIYFHTVEACQPDRCMRQFGLDQPIPDVSRKLRGIHDHTLQGKVDEN